MCLTDWFLRFINSFWVAYSKRKPILRSRICRLFSPVFHSSLPSKYWRRSTLLNLSDRLRTRILNKTKLLVRLAIPDSFNSLNVWPLCLWQKTNTICRFCLLEYLFNKINLCCNFNLCIIMNSQNRTVVLEEAIKCNVWID